jgi:hypothetical protein
MNFNNESGLTFTDISGEEYREYTFPGGDKVRIEHPEKLNVSASGGHRVFDGNGKSHYLPVGFIHIEWEAKIGQPNFVK